MLPARRSLETEDKLRNDSCDSNHGNLCKSLHQQHGAFSKVARHFMLCKLGFEPPDYQLKSCAALFGM